MDAVQCVMDHSWSILSDGTYDSFPLGSGQNLRVGGGVGWLVSKNRMHQNLPPL